MFNMFLAGVAAVLAFNYASEDNSWLTLFYTLMFGLNLFLALGVK